MVVFCVYSEGLRRIIVVCLETLVVWAFFLFVGFCLALSDL